MADFWFRFHHGTVNDPKWRVVATRASRAMSRDVTIGHVLAVWTVMMECASQATPRGELSNWSHEDVGAALGMPEEEVAAIHDAMQGKTLDGNKLTGWNRRQINKEDPTSAERQRRKRERDAMPESHDGDRDEGACHDVSRNVTTDKKRIEEKREEQEHPLPPDGGNSAGAEPPVGSARLKKPAIPYDEILTAYRENLPQLRQPKALNPQRKRAIAKAWSLLPEKHRLAAVFRALFAECNEDPFLNGTGPYDTDKHPKWRPDFDYLISEKVVVRVYESAMDRRERARAQQRPAA